MKLSGLWLQSRVKYKYVKQVEVIITAMCKLMVDYKTHCQVQHPITTHESVYVRRTRLHHNYHHHYHHKQQHRYLLYEVNKVY